MLALARDYAKAELAHIYPPHKKQFIRGIREVRRAARGYANPKSFDLNWEISFANLIFKCQIAQESIQLFAFGCKDTIQSMKQTSAMCFD
jgi:hypothetical protein